MSSTIVVEGDVLGQVEELAQFLDTLSGSDGAIVKEVSDNTENVSATLVEHCHVLSNADAKVYESAYNLLINILNVSETLTDFLPQLLSHLSQPPSFPNGPSLNLVVLNTLFNVVQRSSPLRYQIFYAIVEFTRNYGLFEVLSPQLKYLPEWFEEWQTPLEERKKMYVEIVEQYERTNDPQALIFLIHLLQLYNTSDGNETKSLALKAVKHAIVDPNHMVFDELLSIDAIQSLKTSSEPMYKLLDIVTTKNYTEYITFIKESKAWAGENIVIEEVGNKMRLLTLASLAAQAPKRTLTYDAICKGLDIPKEEVEMWVINVIRAGLVEGKLNQLKQTFLIHRSSHRTFGIEQYKDIQSRLQNWKSNLQEVLVVLQNARETVSPDTKPSGNTNHAAEIEVDEASK